MAAATIMLRDRPSPQSPHHVAVTVDGHPPLPTRGPGQPDYENATPAQVMAFTCMEFITASTVNEGVVGARDDEQAEREIAARPPNRWQGFKDAEIEAIADAVCESPPTPFDADTIDPELYQARMQVYEELVRERELRDFEDGSTCRKGSPHLADESGNAP